MGFANGLRVISLATFVALAVIGVQTAPAAAADPSPSPAPAEASPAPSTESPSPSADSAPSPVPSPDPSPDPVTEASPDPATEASPDPAADPAASPVPVIAPTVVARPSRGTRVARIALAQRGKHYVRGATGPRAFDCSGLVRFAYRRAGVSGRLGGGHSARAMLRWARAHDRTGRRHPRVGDVVIYGGGTHAAIYIGRGRVVSALNPRQGIRVTRLHALGARFSAFIHTRI